MYLPPKLFDFWYKRIYLRSVGWFLTRKRVFKIQGEYCGRCGREYSLQVHHVGYSGRPKPQWWHLLPLARFFMWRLDKSELLVLCDKCHERETARNIVKKMMKGKQDAY